MRGPENKCSVPKESIVEGYCYESVVQESMDEGL